MNLKIGIVGLPNVGKSTLFNALTASSSALAANYPFCTIEPNSATVAVPDERLDTLAKLAGSAKIIPSYIEFIDIAGLVKGASRGEGLGNKFLSHIREVNAIVHVLRCFEDENITHVHGKVDPLYDAEIIETELIIADLESVERQLTGVNKKIQAGQKNFQHRAELLLSIQQTLEQGYPVRKLIDDQNREEIDSLQLLTSKQVLYVCNVLEHESTGNLLSQKVADKAKDEGIECIVISSKIEAEISLLSNDEDKKEFLESLNLTETGLSQLIKTGYKLLNLKSFFTIGPKEAHSWTFKSGISAPQGAGIIHTDFERGFIRAEIISYIDYIAIGGEVKVKEAGKMRLEGKEYKMQDGDIVNFRFNV
ncbi:MAG: redox-regulated ATPase YchF [Rickettsiaceae bacterium]|nr:MAG: redox-regulated ATPase YchF [Rickettsiaceae bacterium]